MSSTTTPRTDTRERIIAAAESLAAAADYQEFTLEKIASLLDVHYTGVYHYFKNRDDLVLEIIERYASRRLQCIAQARNHAGTGLDHLAEFVTREMSEQSSALILRARSTLSEPYRAKAIAAYQTTREALTALIQDGQDDGSFCDIDPQLAAHIILRVLDRYANYNERVISDAHLDTNKLTKALLDFFTEGVGADPQHAQALAQGPRSEFLSIGQDRLSSILIKACQSFNTLGWRGTSIPQIAKEIGMSKTTFYRYAASKEELLWLCTNRSLNLLGQIRQAAFTSGTSALETLLLDIYYHRGLLSQPPGPLLSPYLFDELTDEHRRSANEQYLALRLELCNTVQRCADNGLIRAVNAQAVQPMITACAYIPFDVSTLAGNADAPSSKTPPYFDSLVQFVLFGMGNANTASTRRK